MPSTSPPAHLVLPFAAPLAENGRHALRELQLPSLSRLLTRWSIESRDEGDEWSLTPPHERVLARALGLAGADGCLPWAAHHAQRAGIATDELAWGLITPVHWQVGDDQVSLLDPALLALDDAEHESRALFDAVQPLFEGEGLVLVWRPGAHWLVAHESLRNLPTASIDRVIGRNIDRWLPDRQNARALRRLQNEVQMQLHGDPANEAREARGEWPVNSFWLSGCGGHQPAVQPAGLVVDDRLRAPALGEDWATWIDAWRALDAGPLTQLLDAGGVSRLSLCGERSSVTLAASGGLWQRLTPPWRTAPAHPFLAAL
jgi:hypothetical protein